MADSNVRSNPVNVEQIMEQIRGRITEQRGVEYTEQQIQEIAAAQLEKFLDPRKVRSNLLEEFRRVRASGFATEPPQAADDTALFETDRPWLRPFRLLLKPFARLLLNTRALASILKQSQSEKERRTRDQLLFELIHNLLIETARLGVEVKNLSMKNESLAGRIEFNERRARTLEGALMYQPSKSESAVALSSSATTTPGEPQPERTQPNPSFQGAPAEISGQRRRRRRRRGRRGGGLPSGMGGPAQAASPERGPEGAASAEMAPQVVDDDPGHSADADDGGSDIEPQ